MTSQTIISCHIAGVSHAKPNLDNINAEDEVVIRHEPDNKFDPRAIAVIHPTAGRLGFVPALSTVCVHDAWRNDFMLHAKVTGVADGQYPKVTLVVTAQI